MNDEWNDRSAKWVRGCRKKRGWDGRKEGTDRNEVKVEKNEEAPKFE